MFYFKVTAIACVISRTLRIMGNLRQEVAGINREMMARVLANYLQNLKDDIKGNGHHLPEKCFTGYI